MAYATICRTRGGERDVECNGFSFPEGELRAFDLEPFRNAGGFYRQAAHLADRFKDRVCILYVWSRAHPASFGSSIIYGATVTDENDRVLDRLINEVPSGLASVLFLEQGACIGLSRHAA